MNLLHIDSSILGENSVSRFEHAETYLRTALGFIGITRIEVVAAEGIAVGPDQREAAIAGARQLIAEIAA